MQEANASRNHSPLLVSTNSLLQTTDLFDSLTLPLLRITNRTQLIKTRCSTGSLPPHLLSFLTNDLLKTYNNNINNNNNNNNSHDSKETVEVTAIRDRDSDQENEEKEVRQPSDVEVVPGIEPPSSAAPTRYLLFLLVQDAESVLPDLLTRIMDAIAVLGPENVQLSIVDEGSQDATGAMLSLFGKVLDKLNEGQLDFLSNGDQKKDDGAKCCEKKKYGLHDESTTSKTKSRGHLAYTISTVPSRQSSPETMARIQQIGLEPLLRTTSKPQTERERQELFDRIVFLNPVVTCAEDILELVYQSHLQDADLTCGMDIRMPIESTAEFPGKDRGGHVAQFVFDDSVTRDITGRQLHVDGIFPETVDEESRSRFQKRLPFQVESCWSSIVVAKASAVLKYIRPSTSSSTTGDKDQQEKSDSSTVPCLFDHRASFCEQLWSPWSSSESTPSTIKDSGGLAKIVVLPSILFASSAKMYTRLGLFNGWGLWSKTEKQYQDDQVNKIKAAIRQPVYGYKPSTSSYGYIPRVEEDDVNNGDNVDLQNISDETYINESNNDDTTLDRTIAEGKLSEPVVSLLRERLEEIDAVFGVQDIEGSMLLKQKTERIQEWRPRQPRSDNPHLCEIK
ncbi:capsular associated protein [Gryganskiella cystojenkinii]|nr:capsular associated protein [Gryganskiella cystojenkinii]